MLGAGSPAVERLQALLSDALKLRVLNIPDSPGIARAADARVAILFSGGLDCTVLARMAHELIDQDQSIDLINVAFENPRVAAHLPKDATSSLDYIYEACPDRISGRKSFQELLTACPGRVWRFVAVPTLILFP
jgi:asparagine synthetase B (glutamine-hydrolysing)